MGIKSSRTFGTPPSLAGQSLPTGEHNRSIINATIPATTTFIPATTNATVTNGITDAPTVIEKGPQQAALSFNEDGVRSVLVVATVPHDLSHAVAFWTELECLTGGVDEIIVAAPSWSRPLLDAIVVDRNQTVSSPSSLLL